MAATALSSFKLALKSDLRLQVKRGIIIRENNIRLLTTKVRAEKPVKSEKDSSIPKNVEEFQASQKAKFSPLRSRETNSARISAKVQQPASVFSSRFMSDQKSHESKTGISSHPADAHVGVYDCNNAVSLSSVVSGNVPSPFKLNGGQASSQYNMQGGQACQGDKYVAGDLHDHHHSKNNLKGFKVE